MSVRVVALGDSTVCGMGDPLPDGRWRGFAALLAESLAAAEFTDLAVTGAWIPHVRFEQLDVAVELRPDLACLLAGVNDTMRSARASPRSQTWCDTRSRAERDHYWPPVRHRFAEYDARASASHIAVEGP